jgi:FkbM family methyltransferase
MPDTALKLASAPLRALPAGSGQHRFVRQIFDRWLKNGGPRTGRARVNGAVFDLELSDYIQAQAFLTGRCEPALVNYLARNLAPGDVCFDVGAHIGLVAIPVAKKCPGARVVAFEPHPGSAERITANTALNPGVEVELVAAAAGEEPGSAFLETGGPGTDWHHLGGGQEGDAEGVEVPVTTIDDVCAERGIERISILKMDVEGYEPQALAGAERMLSEGRIDMIVLELVDYVLVRSETTPSELEEQVTALGYTRAEPIPMAGLNRLHRGDMAYSNFAFVRSSDGARPSTTSSKS